MPTSDRQPSSPTPSSATQPVRNPHTIPFHTPTSLIQQWTEAGIRLLTARYTTGTELDSEDLFTELVYGTRIAHDATAGRWCTVADLLRAGAVESWAQLGIAMDITATEARDGFRAWITGQVDLRQRTGNTGITTAQALELSTLADRVTIK